MSISSTIHTTITTAESKALATSGTSGVNVVPVSMVKVNDDSIWLFNFFMDKTVANLTPHAAVALTAWTGTVGVQVKATVTYKTEGDEFDEAVAWVKTQNPSRVVKGLLILQPTAIFDISLGKAFEEDDLIV